MKRILLAAAITAIASIGADAAGILTLEEANRLARLPLKCMQREFPNKPGETLAFPADIGSPQNLHPAFYGCFDWHSSVHGHWMLVGLLKTFPGLEDREIIRRKLAENPTAENIRAEVGYFQRAEEKSFERTYGWAWILKLADKYFSLAPGLVSARADGKLVRLDGLYFSRAWCLYGIADRLDGYGHLRRIADEHMRHSIAAVTAGSYEGEHWLASFALYAYSVSPK